MARKKMKNIVLYMFIGIILSIIAFYFSFRNIPFEEILIYMGTINYWWALLSVIMLFMGFLFRALRWRLILKNTDNIDFVTAYHGTMIAFAINSIFPGRAGEISRPLLIYKQNKISISTGFASVVIDRFFDLVMLLLFFVFIMSFVHIDNAYKLTVGTFTLNKEVLDSICSKFLVFCLVLSVGMFIINMDKTQKILVKIFEKIPKLFSPNFEQKIFNKICSPLIKVIRNLNSIFSIFKNFRIVTNCFGLSLIVWILEALSFYIMALGCPGIDITFFEMTAVLTIVCFCVALPSVPGFWGVWEAGCIFALSLFGCTGKDAAGFTLVNHAMQIFPVMIAGIISIIFTGTNIFQMTKGYKKV